MFTTIFVILMLIVFVEFLWAAARLAWGIGKILFSFVIFPVVMIWMAVSGLVLLAIPILAIVGIIAIILAVTK